MNNQSNNDLRLFIVSGSSQILFLSAALLKSQRNYKCVESDVLIIRGEQISKERKKITETIANKTWSWSKIIWLDDLGFYQNTNKKSFIKSLFVKRVKEIWLSMPYAPIELQFSKIFSSARIVLFDDGLGSCAAPNTFSKYINSPSFIKKRFLLYFNKLTNWTRNVLSLKIEPFPSFSYKNKYTLFSKYGGNKNQAVKYTKVDWTDLKKQVSKILIQKNKYIPCNGPICLILGQYFSESGAITREEEVDEYKFICRHLNAEGYHIIWKEHPKNQKPFLQDLEKEFNEIINLNQYYSRYWPIEIIANDLEVHLYVSCTSTSLISLYGIKDANILSTAPRLQHKLSGADRTVANIMSKKLLDSQLLT
ncbi:alpha-2,8-polysialyltransferase family protein [Seonamhaeicola sp. MEBiC1930]|uniref:polysialyltransferase family glycosyltransferase n=1 Tax=Seonamhaeicola sp. MEBiC01930 TaxID=2976768 RepID=UPI003252ADB4